jgi:hypothetical protein
MISIFGSIGYSILENIHINKKIIIFADMHDKLKKCKNNKSIAEWFKEKFNSSRILLEEVPRSENSTIEELWSESDHTQKLKELYLNNMKKIIAVDIRHTMIPYSMELIDKVDENGQNILLLIYLEDIDSFFSMKHKYMIDNLLNYKINMLKETNLGSHFLKIKKHYLDFLNKNMNILNKPIINITRNSNIIDDINDILNDIMEWYICACIFESTMKTIILHAGLAHTDKVNSWLLNHYKFNIIKDYGINEMNDIMNIYNNDTNGCVLLSSDIEKQFGGKNI